MLLEKPTLMLIGLGIGSGICLVATLIFTGCRLGETLQLKLGDLDFKEKTIRIRQEKKRGEFTRVVPVPSRLYWDIMERYARRIPHKEALLFDITDRQGRNIAGEEHSIQV